MAVEMSGKYLGKLTCQAMHGPSGSSIKTTAPVDNGGDGSLFSPTDLCAVSMGMCMLTIMGQWAQKYDVNVEGATFRVEKHMATEPPRRINLLDIVISVPAGFPADKRERMEAAVMKCPVKLSLHPETEVRSRFNYL